MLRFIKHNLESIDGVSVFPIVSLLLFFTVFVIMLIIVFGYRKKYIDEVSNIPLEEDENNLKI